MEIKTNYYKEILNKFEKLTRREYSFLIVVGFQVALIFSVLTFLTFVVAETLGHFPSSVRTILFFIFILVSFSTFLILFILPILKRFNIFRKTNYYKAAEKVGKYFPDIKDDLLNAIQLVSGKNKQTGYSSGLVEAAFENVYNRTKPVNFESIINFNKAKQLFSYVAGIIIIFGALYFLVPGIRAASNRLLNYNKEFIVPPEFTFKIEPGNAKVTKGDDISIVIKIAGQKPDKVYLAIKNADQTNFEKEELPAGPKGDYKFNIQAVRNSFKYYATAENISSDTYTINVINPPIIK
ncbi:MAG TPA: hypothetical protein ENI76_03970, partial [Ignavibacteria bacterium]|nr:hypothetical protein [Ignavibacteria bacterium]